jgi:hypothetical protein
LGNGHAEFLGEAGEVGVFELGELGHGLEPLDVVALELGGGLEQFLLFFGFEAADLLSIAQIFETGGVDRGRTLNDFEQAGFVESGEGFLGELLEEVEGGGALIGGELFDQGDRFFGRGERHGGRGRDRDDYSIIAGGTIGSCGNGKPTAEMLREE